MGFRKIYHNEIPKELLWKNPGVAAFYLHLKLKAWDKPHKTKYRGKLIQLDTFELPYSISEIEKETGYTQYRVRKILSILIDNHMIETHTRQGFTIIRIIEPQLRVHTP